MGRIAQGVMLPWPNTLATMPSGWTRATAYDSRYVRMIATSATNPGATGGGLTHNHSANGAATHTHPYGAHCHACWATVCVNPNVLVKANSGTFNIGSHNHTNTQGGTGAYSTCAAGATTWSCATVEPPFFTVIFIKSDGSPNGLPNNVLAWFNGAAPTGWTAHASSANRMLKGAAAAGDGGSTGGTGCSHTHSLASHQHSRGGSHTHTVNFGTTCSSPITASGSGGSGVNVLTGHNHPAATSPAASLGGSQTCAQTDTAGAGDVTPSWTKMLPIQNTSGADSLLIGHIAMWDGTIATLPSYWKLADGGGSRPNLANGKFLVGAANSGEVGGTGGADTHVHGSGSHSHNDTGSSHAHSKAAAPSKANNATSNPVVCCTGCEWASHAHAAAAGNTNSVASGATQATAITVAANTANAPTYTAVAYIQLAQIPPFGEGRRADYNLALHGERGRGLFDVF